jgi:type IV pilus assembly protein PilB
MVALWQTGVTMAAMADHPTPTPALPNLLARLVSQGAMTAEAARQVVVQHGQARTKASLPAWLIEHKSAAFDQLALAFSAQFGLPWLDLSRFDLRHAPTGVVSEALLQKHKVLPLARRGKTLSVAVCDPTQSQAIDDIKFQTNLVIDPIIVRADQLPALLERFLAMGEAFSSEPAGSEDFEGLDIVEDKDDTPDMESSSTDDSPVVKFVNKVIVDALRRGASDLHFEPYEDEMRVRFRLDGLLRTMTRAPAKIHTRVASRLKVMSGLDIAERRLPQDGRMKVQVSKTRQIDFRVSTLPTLFGEKIVLRILDASVAAMGIDHLGYEAFQKKLYLDALAQPYGMILVTGPTGSGKTVSLYTGLNILNEEQRNISTAEDPVEIRVKGINQVQVNPKKGLTFGMALRSFLRQDPDVIMVGEIRDLETAEISIKAAQTGHLVLSTLHTNDAPQAVSRLMNMGIAPYNITASVTLVIAQRLARRLHSCKKAVRPPDTVLRDFGFSEADIAAGITVFEPVGCAECNEGFKGRVGVYQVMPMSEEIQKIVLSHGNAMQIAEAAKAAGIPDLRQSGIEKVRQGMTSIHEVERITMG